MNVGHPEEIIRADIHRLRIGALTPDQIRESILGEHADEYVAICAVPPDEVLVSAHHREGSLRNADYVGGTPDAC